MNISTQEQLPGCWVAVDSDTYDGPPAPIGSGRTEQEAIDDLLDKISDDDLSEPFPGHSHFGG